MDLLLKKAVKFNYYFLLLTSYFSLTFAQAPDTLWTKTYGGSGNDRGFSVQQTTDGGYVVAGYKDVPGDDCNFYLIKTDQFGDTLWTKTYGGPSGDFARFVQQTFDEGYIMVGYSYSFSGVRPDVYVVKTDSLGDTLWTKTYGGTEDDAGYCIRQTIDEGYIITGYTSSFGAEYEDLWLIKTDSVGDTLWTKTYGTSGIDGGSSVQQTLDSGYVITGYNGSGGGSSVWIIKTDASGDTVWTKTYGGGNYDCGSSVQQTTDSGFIVVGYTWNFGAGYTDVWLIRTDSLGDTLWAQTYGDTSIDRGFSVKQTVDGGYIIAGHTSSFGAGLDDVYIIKTDSLGDTLWTKTYGGGNNDWGNSIQQTSDGGYVIAGYTESFGAGDYDVWLLKMEPDTFGIAEKKIAPIMNNDFGATIINGSLLLPKGKKCKVFDITGRVVAPDKIKSGIYFIEIDGVVTQKVVKVR